MKTSCKIRQQGAIRGPRNAQVVGSERRNLAGAGNCVAAVIAAEPIAIAASMRHKEKQVSQTQALARMSCPQLPGG
jgi:hypothetical protein